MKKIYLLMAILMAGWIIPVRAKTPDSSIKEKPVLKIGGALRFNYNYSDWKAGCRKRGGDFGFDVFTDKINDSRFQKSFRLEYVTGLNTSGSSTPGANGEYYTCLLYTSDAADE